MIIVKNCHALFSWIINVHIYEKMLDIGLKIVVMVE
jgi:hypothetical protein